MQPIFLARIWIISLVFGRALILLILDNETQHDVYYGDKEKAKKISKLGRGIIVNRNIVNDKLKIKNKNN